MKHQPLPPKLKHINTLARLMDSQFAVPGTKLRFGLDGIIGLIPGVGDLSTFAVSGYLVFLMASNGASGFVLARMILNVLLDVTIGAIPFVGDLFDFAFKANSRNMRLMQEHYREGRHNGSAWKVIIPVLIVLFVVVIAILWLAYKLFSNLWDSIF
jgi:NAD/NADP transhydrogenase beta subunit